LISDRWLPSRTLV